MRKGNQRVLDSGIYARLQAVKMSTVDRKAAAAALLRAEEIVGGISWMKEKIAEAGHAFLKPSLKS